MIAQIRAELLKLRSTRTTHRADPRDDRADPALHAAHGAAHPSGRACQQTGPASAAEPGQLRRRVRRTCRGAACHQRVPLRHDPPDDPVQPRSLTPPERQGRRRHTGRTRVRSPGRGHRLGDRIRHPRRPRDHRRPQQRRHSAAHARRARRRGPVGRDQAPASERSSTTKSAQSSPCSPWASSSTTSCSASSPRSGGSRQPVPRTHSWACESITCSRQAPARSP